MHTTLVHICCGSKPAFVTVYTKKMLLQIRSSAPYANPNSNVSDWLPFRLCTHFLNIQGSCSWFLDALLLGVNRSIKIPNYWSFAQCQRRFKHSRLRIYFTHCILSDFNDVQRKSWYFEVHKFDLTNGTWSLFNLTDLCEKRVLFYNKNGYMCTYAVLNICLPQPNILVYFINANIFWKYFSFHY